jgi:lysophospholipid acyltransferase (LPLAT)-like uncharacterized protein
LDVVPAKTSGLVRPRPLRWYHLAGAWGIYFGLWALRSTIRMGGDLSKVVNSYPIDQPLIYSIWHNRLALSVFLHRHFVRFIGRPRQLAALVSASKDGGIVARVLENFRVQPVRGSTSRRGSQALLELTTWAERGYDLAITPDGPRGPCYRVQMGVISLAQVTGLAVMPVGYMLTRKVRLRSWDRFQVPLPFSRCVIEIGDPVRVPRDASDSDRERLRLELESQMKRLTRD